MGEFNSLSPTFRLFSMPSFWDGMAMALDFAHTMPEFNTDATPEIADARAIAADWRAVGAELSGAVQSLG